MNRPATGGVLAVVAIGLAGLAPLAGGSTMPAREGVVELRAELSSGTPFVDPVALGEWIRDRRDVRLWDVRDDSSAFIRFAVPTAAHVPFERLADRSVGSTTIVLYDDGTGQAVRGWLLLRRLGHPDVRILRGGVLGWIEGVVRPVLPADSPDERARYRRVAAVSRYFGGLPRIGERPRRDTSPEDAVQLLTRRGCY